jgi:serine/threonine protein kinase
MWMGARHVRPIDPDVVYRDVAPTKICETENYRGQRLATEVFSMPNPAGGVRYPVIKMNNLGNELYDNPTILTVKSFMKSLELMALFHTGMIHNDMKGNNMLVSPLTGTVSLIDFGLCKPFDPASLIPPYNERSIFYLARSWYAYPPEFSFLNQDSIDFFDPDSPDQLRADGISGAVHMYINEFTNTNSDKTHHDVLSRQAGETGEARKRRIHAMLHDIHVDYFDPAKGLTRPFKNLQTAVTGDTYTLGLEASYIYGLLPRLDGLAQNPRLYTTAVNVGEERIHGNEFIDRISSMLTCLHPRLRPFHINIIKLFRHYNMALIPEATTEVVFDLGGGITVPYTQLSILNGMPVTIPVNPGMALGSPGCPISADEVSNNLKILYTFLQDDVQNMYDMFYMRNLTYDDILDAANQHVNDVRPTLFFPPPPAPPAPPPAAPPPPPAAAPPPPATPPPATPPAAAAAPPPPATPPGSPFLRAPPGSLAGADVAPRVLLPHEALPLVARPPMHPGVHAALAVGVPGGAAGTPPGHVRINAGVNLFSPHAPRRRGGARGGYLARSYPITLCIQEGLINRTIHIGLFSPGAYICVKTRNSYQEIEAIIRSLFTSTQVGGRIPVNSSKNRLALKNLAKTRSTNKSKKLNRTLRRNRITFKSGDTMPNYSDVQVTSFMNQIMTATTPGKLNVLHAYYVTFLPVDTQETIMKLLFYVPLANPEIIGDIVNYLSAEKVKDLIQYLEGLKSEHLEAVGSVMNVDYNLSEEQANKMMTSYVHGGDARYTELLALFDEMAADPSAKNKVTN